MLTSKRPAATASKRRPGSAKQALPQANAPVARTPEPELADAADVLSDQLHSQLRRLSRLLIPHLDAIEVRFRAVLGRKRLQPIQAAALSAITFGAAARILSTNSMARFIEQVEYNGRRLAKLNLPPSAIVEALGEYDRLLAEQIEALSRADGWNEDASNFHWIREQLHFCVILTLNNAYYQVREAETRAFYELFRVELESRSLEELLQRFLQTLVNACQADAGHLYLVQGEDESPVWTPLASLPVSAVSPPAAPISARRHSALSAPAFVDCGQQPAPKPGQDVVLDPSWWGRYATCWSIPLSRDGRTAGVIQLGFARYYEWLPREQDLLAAAAERCLMAADKARLMDHLAASEEQIRQLAEHMLHVEEMERRRISRELHDEAGQSLLCIRLQMELLEQSLPDSESATREKLREARDLTERTILEMRRLIAALSPAVLEQLGLGAALRQLVARFQRLHPIRVKLSLSRLGGLPQQTEVIVYRLVQECFNNIGKHSGAKNVSVTVTTVDGILKLNVDDDGVGFEIEQALQRRDSFGLSGMRERVTLLGGRFQIRSFPKAKSDSAETVAKPTVTAPLSGNRASASRIKKERGTKISVELPISKSVVHTSEAEDNSEAS